MSSFTLRSVLAFFFVIQVVQATIYVTAPLKKTTCRAGQECLVQWLDNGVAPTLNNIGPCYVGLYNGNNVLVQQIEPVDVSRVASLSFKPDPSAGPNSDTYYINFTSVNPVGNPAQIYSEYSTFFTLTDMSGSLSSPNPSATSLPSVPSTVASAPPNTIATTISITNTFSSSTTASSASSTAASSSGSSAAPSSDSSSAFVASSSSVSSSLAPSTSVPVSSDVPSSSSAALSSSTAVSTTVSQPTSTLVVTPTFVTSRTPSSTTTIVSAAAASVTGAAAASSAFRLHTPSLFACGLGVLSFAVLF